MGVSTDGQLSYGVVFEEDFEFPWNLGEFDDYEEWWESVNGYQYPGIFPFTSEGQYKQGMDRNSPELKAYSDHHSKWQKEHPFPIEVINYCSDGYPMYLLAVKHLTSSRGCPEEINSSFLDITNSERQKLIDFLDTYKIKANAPPEWWLTSYWG